MKQKHIKLFEQFASNLDEVKIPSVKIPASWKGRDEWGYNQRRLDDHKRKMREKTFFDKDMTKITDENAYGAEDMKPHAESGKFAFDSSYYRKNKNTLFFTHKGCKMTYSYHPNKKGGCWVGTFRPGASAAAVRFADPGNRGAVIMSLEEFVEEAGNWRAWYDWIFANRNRIF